jgi:aminocarboxymuconate-semialdehyde decarboxylase
MTTIIDVHTHMLNRDWFELLRQHGAPRYAVRPILEGSDGIYFEDAPFMSVQPGHFDYAQRIERMNEAKVDMAIVSLTCPNVYWGSRAISLQAAQVVNDDMAQAQTAYPDRIRWFASLPWQYAADAVVELRRAVAQGAVGVMVLANIAEQSLTEAQFAPIWQAIDELALPVLVHPTAPPGTAELDIHRYNLIASVGFMFDTSLAISRMMYDGFFERYPHLKVIASHAGGALPYLVGRLDQCYEQMAACRTQTDVKPSEFLQHIYYDAVTYRQEALEMCLAVGGADRVMYGSDYPHNIGDMVGCLARVDNLGDGVRTAVRGQNALRIFNL